MCQLMNLIPSADWKVTAGILCERYVNWEEKLGVPSRNAMVIMSKQPQWFISCSNGRSVVWSVFWLAVKVMYRGKFTYGRKKKSTTSSIKVVVNPIISNVKVVVNPLQPL